MPGIVGIITRKPRALIEPELLRMVDAIRHESFYVTGTWINESLGVYVGWTRLGTGPVEETPLRNERGDVCLIFSGEEYSDPNIGRRQETDARSSSSTRYGYLTRMYDGGSSFIEKLNGMFHGLIVDQARGVAMLFNDRYGMHRVCYRQSSDAFYFAAEAKAILAVHPELRTPNLQSLGEFVACSCILEDRTIFKDIHVLPAASAWSFRNAALDCRRTYFAPKEWEQQTRLGSETYYEELRSCIVASLPRYFSGEQRIGIAMTGGLDTRVILACHPTAPGSIPSYTFGGTYRESQDVRIGRKIAAICQQPHEVIEVGSEFLSRFPRYAERSSYVTEGGVDIYRAADLYVSEKVREIAPVKIVGTYGSEIVRHAVMFKPMDPPAGLFHPEFLSWVHQARETYDKLRREHPVTFAAFRQSPWYHQGILALEQSQLTVRAPFMDNEFVRTAFRAPAGAASNGDVRLRLIKEGNSMLGRIPSDRGVGGNRLSSVLARGVQEFTFKAEYAYDYGMPPWASHIDHFFAPLHLERLFLGRHKLLHFRVWYRDQLSGFVRQLLLDPRTLSRPYLNQKNVEGIVAGHLTQGKNYTSAIHKLLTLEFLQRLFFDSQ
jgi:asparagine synthase (glutamine-hydrolysing)